MSTVEEPTGTASRFVGAKILRNEDPRLLRGLGRYTDDIVLPRMLHAAFVRSPVARAKITSIDVSAARELDGVHAVWTGEDLKDDTVPLGGAAATGGGAPEVHCLAVGDVRFVGDPVAIVVADSRYIAEDACELVDVEYDTEAAVVGRQFALDTTEKVHGETENNIAWTERAGIEEVDAELAKCDHVFTETLHQHRYVNVPMEPRCIIADWQRGDHELVIHTASQNPHLDRMQFSRWMGIPENKVRVVMKDVGGGFGQKIFKGRDEVAAAVASRRLNRPVKWIEDRQENLMAANHAREEQMTVTFGVSKDGIIEAAKIDYLADMGAYPFLPGNVPGALVVSMFPGPYKIKSFGWSGTSVFTNTCGLGAYRGPWMFETTAREIMLDIVARELGIDVAEIRRRNLIKEDELPYTSVSGRVYDRITPSRAFELALDSAGYDKLREEQARGPVDGVYLGIGVSSYIEPTAQGGLPFPFEVAEIRVEASGKVNVFMGTGSHGHSLETTMIQVVADNLGVRMDDVVLHQGDTENTPAGGGTAGSRSGVSASAAARMAAIKVKEKTLAIAAHQLEAAAEDLEIHEGTISVKGSPNVTMSFAEVAAIASARPDKMPEGMEPGLENTSRYVPTGPTYANATQICVCEVDTKTGLVFIRDYVVAGDCGMMINPMVVEGQVTGGVIQGIGGVLLEHLPYDDAGNPLAITFKDYLMPTTDTMPDIRQEHIETHSGTPGGHKGVGEGGAIGASAAVVNAVADALAPLGVRIVDQPLSPTKVLEYVAGAGNGASNGHH